MSCQKPDQMSFLTEGAAAHDEPHLFSNRTVGKCREESLHVSAFFRTSSPQCATHPRFKNGVVKAAAAAALLSHGVEMGSCTLTHSILLGSMFTWSVQSASGSERCQTHLGWDIVRSLFANYLRRRMTSSKSSTAPDPRRGTSLWPRPCPTPEPRPRPRSCPEAVRVVWNACGLRRK